MNTLKFNCDRASCKDVFKAFLVEKANYEGELEIPIINGIKDIPDYSKMGYFKKFKPGGH